MLEENDDKAVEAVFAIVCGFFKQATGSTLLPLWRKVQAMLYPLTSSVMLSISGQCLPKEC